jgi:hypothetical protein
LKKKDISSQCSLPGLVFRPDTIFLREIPTPLR